MDGSSFFDNDAHLAEYLAFRDNKDTPNETLEKPIVLELLADVSGKRILDLGCGDAFFGLELLQAGCAHYTGLEASEKMAAEAKKTLQGQQSEVIHRKLEDWHFPATSFDLVVSRLALHYVEDLDSVFAQIYETLKPEGKFVFSIVHPVITSSDKSRSEGGIRQDWVVDDYFKPGAREVYLLGAKVKQYHRTLEALYLGLQTAGFKIEHLRESQPQPERFEDEALYQRRLRIPLFLFFSAQKV